MDSTNSIIGLAIAVAVVGWVIAAIQWWSRSRWQKIAMDALELLQIIQSQNEQAIVQLARAAMMLDEAQLLEQHRRGYVSNQPPPSTLH